jgi:hypothetical protein
VGSPLQVAALSRIVARIKGAEICDELTTERLLPDCASLHPGYCYGNKVMNADRFDIAADQRKAA